MTEPAGVSTQNEPVISVCMAAFNGERYIADQLHSILMQLREGDEVIVVDDASTDGTREAVRGLHDSRITLICNPANRGVLQSFGAALAHAGGDIVFLSDQDDLWLPGKVETVLKAFAQDPDLVLVASDATLIDEQDRPIGDSYYAERGQFNSGLWNTLLKCKFLGCTMAFRAALLSRALPFPNAPLVHHDIWLGCINAMNQGKVAYIPRPLVAYRRHSTNVTGRVKNGFYKMFRMRLQLFLALLRHSLFRHS
jgi:glycosyltransferase involved in cell wall biosynthesis